MFQGFHTSPRYAMLGCSQGGCNAYVPFLTLSNTYSWGACLLGVSGRKPACVVQGSDSKRMHSPRKCACHSEPATYTGSPLTKEQCNA
jgi:hypothetical protein